MQIGTHNIQQIARASSGEYGGGSLGHRGHKGEGFSVDAELLKRLDAKDVATDRVSGTRDDDAMEAAKSLVSIGLIQPLLAQARNDPFKSDLFHGGQGEKVFGAQLDSIFAERVTQKMGLSLVDVIYRRIAKAGVGDGNAGGLGGIDARG